MCVWGHILQGCCTPRLGQGSLPAAVWARQQGRDVGMDYAVRDGSWQGLVRAVCYYTLAEGWRGTACGHPAGAPTRHNDDPVGCQPGQLHLAVWMMPDMWTGGTPPEHLVIFCLVIEWGLASD